MPKPKRYAQLLPEFIQAVASSAGGWTIHPAFYNWLRSSKRLRKSRHNTIPLREGEPVHWETAEGFWEWAVEKRGITLDREHSLRECQPPSDNGKGVDWLRRNFPEYFATLMNKFELHEPAYCENEADVWTAAELIVDCVGRERPDLGPPRLVGETLMQRSLQEYFQQLLMLWQHNVTSVVFSVVRIKNGKRKVPTRVGASVIVPLTESCYERIKAGTMCEKEITSHDLESPSLNLFFAALAEGPPATNCWRATISRSQAHTVCYQAASLAKPIVNSAGCPRMLSFGGTRENIMRAERYGFQDLQRPMKDTGTPLLELAPPAQRCGRLADKATWSYEAFAGVLRLYQTAIVNEQEMHDAQER